MTRCSKIKMYRLLVINIKTTNPNSLSLHVARNLTLCDQEVLEQIIYNEKIAENKSELEQIIKFSLSHLILIMGKLKVIRHVITNV